MTQAEKKFVTALNGRRITIPGEVVGHHVCVDAGGFLVTATRPEIARSARDVSGISRLARLRKFNAVATGARVPSDAVYL